MDAIPVPCFGCGKIVYPPEQKRALKQIWHKGCIKCTVCKIVLNDKSMESFNNQPYCRAHLVNAKMGGGIQDMRNPLGTGEVVNAQTKVQASNQSTENTPQQSTISYQTHNQNQSTENTPQKSTISYPNASQSLPRSAPSKPPGALNKPTPTPAPSQPRSNPIPTPTPPPPPVQQEEPQQQYDEPQQEEPQQEEPQQQYDEPQQEQSSGYVVGTECQAQYSADGQYYAAVIEQVDNGQYLVRYTEYDETEWVSDSQIRV